MLGVHNRKTDCHVDAASGTIGPTMTPATTVFELSNATVRFGDQLALDVGERLALSGGRSVAIMGPNGSGKTTLLNVLAGLQPLSSGKSHSPDDPVISIVAQHQHQHAWMPITVREVLGTGHYRRLGLFRPFRSSHRSAMASAARRLEIDDLLDSRFGELSGGQRQRTLLAAALVSDPDCLLLDEPITGLDLGSQQIILDLVSELRDLGRLVILSTHHLAEARACDETALLNTTLIAHGPTNEVLTSTNLTAAFGGRIIEDPATKTSDTDDTGIAFTESSQNMVIVDDHGHGDHRSPKRY